MIISLTSLLIRKGIDDDDDDDDDDGGGDDYDSFEFIFPRDRHHDL